MLDTTAQAIWIPRSINNTFWDTFPFKKVLFFLI